MADHTGDAQATNDDAEHRAAPLSAEGEARRDAMLAGLLAHVPRAAAARRRRRTAVRGAGATLAAALVVWVWTPGGAPTRSSVAPPASAIVRVATDPGVLARLAPTTGGVVVERVSDDELLRTLSAIGRPVGLVRDGDRVALTAEVADPIAPASPAL